MRSRRGSPPKTKLFELPGSKKHPRNGHKWKQAEDVNLRYFYEIRGLELSAIADILGRGPHGIKERALYLNYKRSLWYLQEAVWRGRDRNRAARGEPQRVNKSRSG